MSNLTEDIRKYLKKNSRIKGFSKDRIQEIISNPAIHIHGYEWRLLVAWSGLYVYQFEEKYNVKINEN